MCLLSPWLLWMAPTCRHYARKHCWHDGRRYPRGLLVSCLRGARMNRSLKKTFLGLWWTDMDQSALMKNDPEGPRTFLDSLNGYTWYDGEVRRSAREEDERGRCIFLLLALWLSHVIWMVVLCMDGRNSDDPTPSVFCCCWLLKPSSCEADTYLVW